MPIQLEADPNPTTASPHNPFVVGTLETDTGDLPEDLEWKAEFVAATLCGIFGLSAAFIPNPTIKLILFVLSYIAGAWFSAIEVVELLRKRILDVHFLMLLVAAGSAIIGAWGEGATLLFLFSFSGALEQYALGRTQREIRSLFKTSPKTARLYENGEERSVPVDSVRPGMHLLVKPGDLVPVDCEVLKGTTACDESTLTGEAVPVEKGPGETLYAGTLNLWGAIEARATRAAAQSALSRVIEIIKEAQHLKAPAQRFTDRFGTFYTYAIMALAGVMFFIWWQVYHLPAFKGIGENTAFYRSMVLLVVASPCALVLSIPSAILSAIAFGAKRGILFRGGSAVERLGDTSVVVMDKTGTITTGDLRVEKIESFPPGHETEIATLAYSLEAFSTHPLARAITTHGKKLGLDALPVQAFESVTGAGVRARVRGEIVQLGKREWVDAGHSIERPKLEPGYSEVWLSSGALKGVILLRDDIREHARELVNRLHDLRIRTVLLTGDRHETAELARQITGIQEVRGGLKPEDKLRAIIAYKRRGEKVAMIGDGVNDAPSLAAADVGVAMGARGSDAALEQADVVLMNDRLENFLTALRLSKRARRVIHQNLLVSLGTVVLLVTFAMMGNIPLTIGVVGHEGSTVIVVLNSLRLLLREKKEPGAEPTFATSTLPQQPVA
ncbi:MAG: heavy metal translocating P-type ATPase [Verrucomicrobiota bacterium]